MGIPWNSMGDSWMGGWHGGLPWQGHVENAMGIPWNSMGGWTPGWGGGMEAFHGKAMWRTPWASHGNPWGTPGWVDGMEAFQWQGHVENTMGIPWNSMGRGGDSRMGGWHGGLPMARPCGEHHGHPMEFHGGEGWTPGWVDGMEVFHGKTMWRTPWASHGIPWGTPGWVDGMEAFHGKAMWITPWASHGIPWEGGLLDGWVAWRPPMARPCGEHHGHPMEFHGGLLDGW